MESTQAFSVTLFYQLKAKRGQFIRERTRVICPCCREDKETRADGRKIQISRLVKMNVKCSQAVTSMATIASTTIKK
jgi:hypothetical protein